MNKESDFRRMDKVAFIQTKNATANLRAQRKIVQINSFKTNYENDRLISQRTKGILKFKIAFLIKFSGSYWFNSPRKFQDGEINRWIIEIKRGAIKKVFFNI